MCSFPCLLGFFSFVHNLSSYPCSLCRNFKMFSRNSIRYKSLKFHSTNEHIAEFHTFGFCARDHTLSFFSRITHKRHKENVFENISFWSAKRSNTCREWKLLVTRMCSQCGCLPCGSFLIGIQPYSLRMQWKKTTKEHWKRVVVAGIGRSYVVEVLIQKHDRTYDQSNLCIYT